jgi:hypothetical protein
MQPSTRVGLILLAICAVCAILYSVFNKPAPSDKEQIASQLLTGIKAANAGSTHDVLGIVSDNYKDSSGSTKKDVERSLLILFQNEKNVHYELKNPLITINGDHAVVHFNLVVTDRTSNYEIGSRDVEVDLEREQTKTFWIFTSTHWEVVSSNIPAMDDTN